MEKKITAWAWASGLIEFGDVFPDGALPIITGDEEAVREIVTVNARMSYENKPLVPGIPEAPNQHEACDALMRFSHRVKKQYQDMIGSGEHEH